MEYTACPITVVPYVEDKNTMMNKVFSSVKFNEAQLDHFRSEVELDSEDGSLVVLFNNGEYTQIHELDSPTLAFLLTKMRDGLIIFAISHIGPVYCVGSRVGNSP